MVGSFGVVPVSALVGSAQALSAASASFTPASSHPLTLIDNVGLQTLKLSPHQTIEVIVGLEGRSLAAEQTYRESMGLPALDAAGQSAYVASLEKAQAPIVAAFEHAGATVRYQYHILYNGIDAVASQAALAQMVRVPGVQRIDTAQQENLLLDNSVPFIFDNATYADLGADGTGVTVALIDTGIDYTHAAFGGAGTPAAYAAIDPTTLVGSGFPTPKVIGGYDLVGENYDARGSSAPGGTCSDVPVPDQNPLDINGHGTHTADVAAGEEVKVGNTITTYHGVAPGALIYEYKVFSGCAADGTASTDNSNVIAAMEMAMDPNGDGSTSDHADVISMSLGGDFGRGTTPDSVAANAAVDLGAVVVASAGNAGNIPYITGSPGTASKVISVAAGNDPGVGIQYLKVEGADGADGNYVSVEGALTPPLTSTGAVSGGTVSLNQTCFPLPAGSLDGLIPLIARGTCTFALKILNAQAAGAIGVVVTNNVAGAPIVMGGDSTGINIPAVMISLSDGNAIRSALTGSTVLILDPANFLPQPNQLASFTSAGPRFGDSAIKPDVTAPGVNILSAEVGTGTASTSVSGTSFSAPHVAGAAAILLQLHPSWKPAEIKAALMNTATDASPDGAAYPVALMGAGRIRVDVAAKIDSLALPGSLSFGVTEDDQGGFHGVQFYTQWLTLENKDNHGKFFSLNADFRLSAFDDGSIHMLYPPFVYVSAHHSQKVAFTLVVNYNALSSPYLTLNEIDGFLTLTQSGGGDVLRVPFLILPIARSDVDLAKSGHSWSSGSSLTFQNTGLQPSGVDIFQFGVSSPHQQLIPKTPGAPRDPSDWFDIRYTGARAYDVTNLGRILEFGVSTYGPWSTASNMEIDFYIDANGDAVPDYLVAVLDYGLLTTGTPDGLMASAVCALPSFACFAEFLVSNANNVAWQTAPILLDDLNFLGSVFGLPQIDASNPSFSYFVVTTDLQTGYYDMSGSAMFNAINPAIDVDANYFEIAAGGKVTVNVVGGPGKLLALLENNIGGTDQSMVITVSHGHH